MPAPSEGTNESGDNGNGRVTRAWIAGEITLLANKIDNLTAIMNECKIGLNNTVAKIHNQDIEINTIKTELQDFIEFKRSIIKQAAALVLGSAGLSAVLSYIIQQLAK